MTAAESPEGGQEPARRPRGRPYRNVSDVRSVSMLGLGMIVGAVLGAGVALLVAPRTGSEVRHSISRRARRLRRGSGPWSRLGKELRRAAAAKRKSLESQSRRDEIEAKRAARAAGV